MQSNPFSLSFGKEPKNVLKREQQFEMILSNYLQDTPSTDAYIITGVRGSGKTVLLSQIYKYFNLLKDWIVVELNPSDDMIEDLAASIYEQVNFKFKYMKKEFSFSFKGVSFSISGDIPVSNAKTLIEKMLAVLKKTNKKVLICVDEINNNDNVKKFIQQYQIYIRKEFQLYLVMTGLYENVRSLQNEKSLTFLYRTPQIELNSLPLIDIYYSFKDLLNIDDKFATKLAKLTNGYAYAYQTLGYLVYENKYTSVTKELLEKFDYYLRTFVYEKIYDDLPNKEKEIIVAMTELENVKDIREKSNLTKESFSQYRSRLLKKGIVMSPKNGILQYTLPRFKEFINLYTMFY